MRVRMWLSGKPSRPLTGMWLEGRLFFALLARMGVFHLFQPFYQLAMCLARLVLEYSPVLAWMDQRFYKLSLPGLHCSCLHFGLVGLSGRLGFFRLRACLKGSAQGTTVRRRKERVA